MEVHMVTNKTGEVIEQLKRIKEERGLSYQNIIDMVEESGGYTSMSTVRRVFAPNAEYKNFRYEESVKPIVIALLGINEPPVVGEDVSPEQHEIDTLKTVIQLKEQISENLITENERLKDELLYAKTDYARRAEDIKAASRERHEILQTQLVQKEKWLIVLTVLLFSVMIVLFGVLIYDIVSPSIGFVRHSTVTTAVSPFLHNAAALPHIFLR